LDFASRFGDIGAIFERALVSEQEQHQRRVSDNWWQRSWSKFWRRHRNDSERVLTFLPKLDENQIIALSSDALGVMLPVHRSFKEGAHSSDRVHDAHSASSLHSKPVLVDNAKKFADTALEISVINQNDSDHKASQSPTAGKSETDASQLGEKYGHASVHGMTTNSQSVGISTAVVKQKVSRLRASNLESDNMFELREVVVSGVSRDSLFVGDGSSAMHPNTHVTAKDCRPSRTSDADGSDSKAKMANVVTENKCSAVQSVSQAAIIPPPPPRSRSSSRTRHPVVVTCTEETRVLPSVLLSQGGAANLQTSPRPLASHHSLTSISKQHQPSDSSRRHFSELHALPAATGFVEQAAVRVQQRQRSSVAGSAIAYLPQLDAAKQARTHVPPQRLSQKYLTKRASKVDGPPPFSWDQKVKIMKDKFGDRFEEC
jgi:hypothetical protein